MGRRRRDKRENDGAGHWLNEQLERAIDLRRFRGAAWKWNAVSKWPAEQGPVKLSIRQGPECNASLLQASSPTSTIQYTIHNNCRLERTTCRSKPTPKSPNVRRYSTVSHALDGTWAALLQRTFDIIGPSGAESQRSKARALLRLKPVNSHRETTCLEGAGGRPLSSSAVHAVSSFLLFCLCSSSCLIPSKPVTAYSGRSIVICVCPVGLLSGFAKEMVPFGLVTYAYRIYLGDA